ncbi:DUF397 domain-containing protein [Actinophytocola sp.]|uniref:DUF397 domain-containing protein n=1 Tax=Actinophytocola sp. TaxID=1872138 RepID=UPI0039C85F7D
MNSSGRQFHASERTERYVSARMSRQARLTGPSPLKLHALIDEAVVRRVVGSPQVMAEQLDHLLDMGKRDNVTIQVVPFDVGAYGTMSGAIMIIGYPGDDDLPAVYLEHAAGGVWVEMRVMSAIQRDVRRDRGPGPALGEQRGVDRRGKGFGAEMTDHIRWRKSSRSGANANGCVEFAHTRDRVRDSKNPAGPSVRVDLDALLAAVKADHLGR